MIDANCFGGFPQMTYCAGIQVFGGPLFASVAFMIIFAYAMHRFGLSMTTSVTLSTPLLFAMFWITGQMIFSTLLLLIMLGIGAIFAIVLVRQVQR